MTFDEGINWGGDATAAAGVNIEIELDADGTTTTGVIRLKIGGAETPEELARMTAKEWNDRKPIEGVFALETADSGLIRFLHSNGQIVGIAITFDGKTRTPLGIGDSASSLPGDLSVQRVQIPVDIAAISA